MEDVKLLSEARIRASLFNVSAGYKVHCKHLLCREDYNMGNRKFVAGKEYDIWIAYDLNQSCRRYQVHGLTTRDEVLPFSTDKVFGSLEEVIAAPETKSLSYGRWEYHLVSLPELGKTLVPAWMFETGKVRQVWDADTQKRLKNVTPGLLNYNGRNYLAWLVQDDGKDFRAFVSFDNPTVIELMEAGKVGFFIPLSGNNGTVGNNCFWYYGNMVRFA